MDNEKKFTREIHFKGSKGDEFKEIEKEYIRFVALKAAESPKKMQEAITSIMASIAVSVIGSALFSGLNITKKQVGIAITEAMIDAVGLGLIEALGHIQSAEFDDYLNKCRSEKIIDDLGLQNDNRN